MATTRDFLHKFLRAQSHLDDLNAKVKQWLDNDFRTITHEKHPNRPGYFIAYVIIDDSPVDSLAVLVGDVIHNLRGTLDHLAYTLAENHTGIPLPDNLAQNSEFPIFGDKFGKGIINVEKHYADDFLRKIGGIDPAAQAIIKGLQPYHMGNKFTTHPLWMLHELSNIDKHRLLLTGAVQNISGMFRHERNFTLGEVIVNEGYLRGKAEIVTYSGWPTDPSKEMYVEYMPIIEITFRCGSTLDGISVQLSLKEIVRYIAHVINALDKFI